MRTRKYKYKHTYRSRKSRRGGFFSYSKKKLPECDMVNLSVLSKDTGDGEDPLIKMRNNYKKCCPKDFMGRKNSSPYCKQLDLNFKSLSNYQRDIEGYYGEETDVSKIKKLMNEPVMQMQDSTSASTPMPTPTPTSMPTPTPTSMPAPILKKKPWYQFWGGKKHKRTRHQKKRTYRRK